jgi:hypothetical protein
MGKYEDATRLFKEYLSSTPEADKALRSQALALTAKRKHDRAGLLYAVLGAHEEAGEAYKKAWNNGKAAQEFMAASRYYDAALLFEYAKRNEEALAAWKIFKPDTHKGRFEKLTALRTHYWNLARKNPTKSKGYNQGIANALFAEATDMFNAGDYLNALAIYIQFNEKEKVVESLLPLEDDTLAVYTICLDDNFVLWSDYRKRKKIVRLDAELAITYVSKQYPSLEKLNESSDDTISGLFQLLGDVCASIEKEKMEILNSRLDFYIFSIEYNLLDKRDGIARWGKSFMKILAALRQYSRIISFGRSWYSKNNDDREIDAVIESLDELSVSHNDEILKLCKTTIKNQPRNQEIIDTTPVDIYNWNVMRLYPEKKEEILEFLTSKDLCREAAQIIQTHSGSTKAAEYLEAHGILKEAASQYETALEWGKAKTIYEKLRDPKAIARLYEHKGDFAQAIDQWKKLGHPRQVERLQQKQKKLAALEQAQLFDFETR